RPTAEGASCTSKLRRIGACNGTDGVNVPSGGRKLHVSVQGQGSARPGKPYQSMLGAGHVDATEALARCTRSPFGAANCRACTPPPADRAGVYGTVDIRGV